MATVQTTSMYGDTEEGFYDAAGTASDGLYDAPCEIPECSTSSSVVKNKYAVTYNLMRSNFTPNDEGRETQETYAVVNKNRTNENKRGSLEVQNNVQECKDYRNNEKMSQKYLQGKGLSMMMRRLSNLLLFVLVIGLVSTSYMLYHVQNDLKDHKERTTNLRKEAEQISALAKIKMDTIDNILKETMKNVSGMTNQTKQTVKEMTSLGGEIRKEGFEIHKTSNETENKITSVDMKVLKVEQVVKEVAKNTSRMISKSEKRVAAIKRTITKNISDVRNVSTENDRKISKMKIKYGNEIERMAKKSNKLNETLFQMRLYGQFKEQFKGKLGMSFEDVLRLTNQTDHAVSEDTTPMKQLEYKYKKFKTQYKSTWQINYTEVTRLSKKIDFKVNEQVPILLKIDYMYKTFTENHKEWGITFSDLIILTMEIDFKVGDPIPVIQELDTMFNGFKDIWGAGTFNHLIGVMKNLDEKERKGIKDSVARIKRKGKLKFIPAPKTPTAIPARFSKENDKVYVEGFVKIYEKGRWNMIFYYFWDTYYYHYFGNAEAKVTCRTGGYTTGEYVTYEKNRSKSPTLYYLEKLKCTGEEQDVNDCSVYAFRYYDHYFTTVKVKCNF